jgi:hypothetical protein
MTNGRLRLWKSSGSFINQGLDKQPQMSAGVRQSRDTKTPGFASLNPGLISPQPSGLHLHAGGV